MSWSEIENDLKASKKSYLNILEKMSSIQKIRNYPLPDISYEHAWKLLEKPNYNVVVCGEVKRGKSSFINALIGKEILPTGVRETTSQVFRISNAENDSYFLVFDNDTRQEISFEELTRYGSQVDADLKGEAIFKGRNLSYIQINTKTSFLPEGVSIFDTPGLGALYKSHSEITNSYVSIADIVVFVLDSNQPLVQQEKEFLEKVYSITPHVLFIQTKIDTVSEENWINIIRRSEELIQDSFKDKNFQDVKIYPISSSMLFKAANQENTSFKELLVKNSHFIDFKNELEKRIYYTSGFQQIEAANKESIHYYNAINKTLDEQIAILSSHKIEFEREILQKKAKVKKVFDENWAQGSDETQKVFAEIQSILNAAKNETYQIFERKSELHNFFMDEIDALNNPQEIAIYSKNLTERVVSKINLQWQSIAKEAQRLIFKKVDGVNQALNKLSDSLEITKSDISTQLDTDLKPSEFFHGFRNQSINASIAISAASTLLGFSLSVIWPIAVGAIVWSYFIGKKSAQEEVIRKSKNELKSKVSDVFDDVRKQLLGVAIMEGKHKSTVDGFIAELSTAVEATIHKTIERKKSQLNEELLQIDTLLKNKTKEGTEQLAALSAKKMEWGKIGVTISEQQKILEKVSTAFV